MVKKIITIVFNVIMYSCIFTGCKTTDIARDNTELIIANTRAVQQLENTVTALNEVLGRSSERIDSIREQSLGITDGIEKLEYLFGQYEREVIELLKEIEQLRTEVEIKSKDINDIISSLHTNDYSKDSNNDIKN